jgi:hypothetical protein
MDIIDESVNIKSYAPTLPTESSQLNTQTNNVQHTTPANFVSSTTPHINVTTGHLSFGDKLEHKPEYSTTRIYLQNINGCKLSNLHYECQSAIKYLHQHAIDIASLTETRTEWTSTNYNKLKNILNQQFPMSCLTTSHFMHNMGASYHPGGTATILTGSAVSRKRGIISDPLGLGRWSGFSIQLKNLKQLHIITAYRPNQDSKFGSNTTYQQQFRYLRLQGHDNPDPRKIFLKDLTTIIQKLHHQNDLIILNWDANEETSGKHLAEFLKTTNLTSLMHNVYDKMSTYARGHHIIDHIMGSPELKQYVRRSGYLPFYSGAWISDHRPMYLDLEGILNNEIPHVITQRQLRSNNKKAIEKFLRAVPYNDLHNLHTNITTLEQTTNWTTAEHNILETVDTQFTALLLQAEKSLNSHYHHDWSMQLHEQYGIYIYWKTRKMCSNNRIRNPELLQQLTTQYGEHLYQGNIHRSIYGQYKLAIKNLKKLRQNAADNRINFVDARTSQALAENKTTKVKVLKQMKTIEAKNRCFRILKHHNKPKQNSGISHILVNKSAQLQRIDDINEVETTLHTHFQYHFNQATGTPFTEGILRQVFGYSGVTEHTTKLLQGTLPPLNTTKEVNWLLQNIRQSRPPMSSYFPPDDIKHGFLRWRESTTTSPSGKHLGFYRSIITAIDHNIQSSDEDNNQTSKAHLMFNIQQLLINLAIREIHTFERWKVVHNFVIEKIPGYPLISKLRVIHLFEADWNIILKYFTGRTILRQAVREKTVCEEQAGGRPGRRSIDEAVQTILTYETCILQHQTGGITYNDAKSCYDRIPENLSNISAMKEGLPENLALLHANTMQQIKYHLKHQQGIAKIPNQHNDTYQFHGVGQGAGDAPARWGYMSDTAIQTYNQHSTPAVLRSPITNITTDKRIQAFVDDCRLFNLNPTQLLFAALNTTIRNTQLWEGLLYSISGKLELDKSKICIFGWRYDTDGNVIPDDTYNKMVSLIMESESHQAITIGKIMMHEAYKLLGVFIPFYGTMKEHHQYLIDKCHKFTHAFHHIPLPPSGILLGIKTTINPTLSYSLPATYIDEKHINSITNKLNYNLLPKLGFNRHFPKVLLTAPTTYGGVNLLNLYDQQGIAHLDIIYRHFHSQTSLTKTIIQATESFQIKSGQTTSCWLDTTHFLHVQAPWINITRRFMQSIQLTMEIPQIGTCQLLRDNDKQLISPALMSFLTNKEIKIFNNTRLFLQVTSLAEITNTEGTSIHPHYLSRTPPKHRTIINGKSKLGWPVQPPPNRRMWRVWLKGIQFYCRPSSSVLKQRLGHWTSTCHGHRTWFATEFSLDGIRVQGHIWQRTDNNNQVYTPTNRTVTTLVTGKPILPYKVSDTQIVVPYHRREIGVRPPSSTSWSSYLQNNITTYHPITLGTLQIHVQGSYKHNTQGFAWEVRQFTQIKATHTSTTSRVYQPSIALATIIGLISVLTYLQPHYSQQPIEIYINKETIKFLKATSQHKYNNYIIYLQYLQHLLPWTLYSNDNDALTQIANITIQRNQSIPHILLPTTVIRFALSNTEITQNLPDIIRQHRHHHPIRDFFMNKYQWTPSTFKSIDWQLHDNLVQNSPYREFTIKLIHFWLPVASHPALANINHHCIRCNACVEDQEHWYRCPQNRQFQIDCRIASKKFFQRIHLHDDFHNPILESLYAGTTSHLTVPQTLYAQQTAIGWDHLIRGRITKRWIKEHNKITGANNSREIFQQVLHHINFTLFKMWKHRNEDVHGTDPNIQQRYFESFLIPRVTYLYSKKHLLPAIDQQNFTLPLQELLHQPKAVVERWLDTNEAYLKISIQRESKRIKEGNTNITTYFQPQPNRPQLPENPRQTAGQPSTTRINTVPVSVHKRQVSIANFVLPKQPRDIDVTSSGNPHPPTQDRHNSQPSTTRNNTVTVPGHQRQVSIANFLLPRQPNNTATLPTGIPQSITQDRQSRTKKNDLRPP